MENVLPELVAVAVYVEALPAAEQAELVVPVIWKVYRFPEVGIGPLDDSADPKRPELISVALSPVPVTK